MGDSIMVRMMLPKSIRCNTCGTCIYGGTVFNSRKEGVIGEITMRTCPQNSDYVVESGAVLSFEPWHDEEATEREKIRKMRREAEEIGNAMKSLEIWAMDSKQYMDIL